MHLNCYTHHKSQLEYLQTSKCLPFLLEMRVIALPSHRQLAGHIKHQSLHVFTQSGGKVTRDSSVPPQDGQILSTRPLICMTKQRKLIPSAEVCLKIEDAQCDPKRHGFSVGTDRIWLILQNTGGQQPRKHALIALSFKKLFWFSTS